MRRVQWGKMTHVGNAWRVLGRSFVGALAIMAHIGGVASSAEAQGPLEISGTFGYSFSEGVSLARGALGSEFIDKVDVGSAVSYGGAINFWVDDQNQFGFQFGLQTSSLIAKGSQDLRVTDMNVYSYHGVYTYNAGSSSSSIRPFVMFGLGATQYEPSDLVNFSFDGEVQFSGTLGGGVKTYVDEHLGFSFTARWTPTYIKSDPAGVYCSPYWTPWYGGGCAVMLDPDYSNQFRLSAGIIYRL